MRSLTVITTIASLCVVLVACSKNDQAAEDLARIRQIKESEQTEKENSEKRRAVLQDALSDKTQPTGLKPKP